MCVRACPYDICMPVRACARDDRFGCIVFCLLEVAINVLEHYNHFWLLALGRVMGGISTSLLFTAFETW